MEPNGSCPNRKVDRIGNALVPLSKTDEEDFVCPSLFCISVALLETAESFREYAAARQHSLVLDIEPGQMYNGEEYTLRQLTGILLENAVKYAAENSEIRFFLKRQKKGIFLTCENRCETLPDSHQADRLFDRFYQVDPSRNRKTDGFGIGLSIARNIAEAHRGSITAQILPDDKICFSVFLPEHGKSERKKIQPGG